MSCLTENETYWSETWCEILSSNGVDVCVDQKLHEAIAKDFAANAEVQVDYTAPVQSECEIDKLKLQIKKLESRRPCTNCGGHGGRWIKFDLTARASFEDCMYCNGRKWLD